MATDTATKSFLARLPQDDYNALRNLAFFTGLSMNSLVVDALHAFLATTGRDMQLEASLERGREHYRTVLDKLAVT